MIARKGQRRQRGAILIISLIMLLVIATAAVTALQGAGVETRMAVNQQRVISGFHFAEAARHVALQGFKNDKIAQLMTEAKASTVGTVIDSSTLTDGEGVSTDPLNAFRAQLQALDPHANVSMTARYMGGGSVAYDSGKGGYTLNEGSGFKTHYFEVGGTSTLGNGSTYQSVQGIVEVAPSG